MTFTTLIYYVSCYKEKYDLYKYMEQKYELIKVKENDLNIFFEKYDLMIKNNKQNNISKLKLYENNLVECFIIIVYGNIKVNEINTENEYFKILFENYNNKEIKLLVNVKKKNI